MLGFSDAGVDFKKKGNVDSTVIVGRRITIRDA